MLPSTTVTAALTDPDTPSANPVLLASTCPAACSAALSGSAPNNTAVAINAAAPAPAACATASAASVSVRNVPIRVISPWASPSTTAGSASSP